MLNVSMERKLQLTTVMLEIIDNDVSLQEAITQYGFDSVRLDEGRKLLGKARNALADFQQQRGRILGTRETLREDGRDVRESYMNAVTLARRALINEPEGRMALSLDGPRERLERRAAWIAQAWTFYRNVDARIQPLLDRFGLTEDRLATDAAALTAYSQALAKEQEQSAGLIKIRLRRTRRFDALTTWLADLIAVLRIISKGDPALRNKLGLDPDPRRSSSSEPSSLDDGDELPVEAGSDTEPEPVDTTSVEKRVAVDERPDRAVVSDGTKRLLPVSEPQFDVGRDPIVPDAGPLLNRETLSDGVRAIDQGNPETRSD